jgi:hypothetical protein
MIPLRHTIGAVIGAATAALIAALPALSMEPLSLNELDEVRAGFRVGGIDVGYIGMQLHTSIDGMPVMTSTATWDDNGVAFTQQLHDVANIVPIDQASQLGLDISNIEGNGVVVRGVGGGATAVIQTLNASQVRNLVVNTANNRTVLQDTQLTFVIPNLPDLQQSMQLDRIRAGLDAALTAGMISAIH